MVDPDRRLCTVRDPWLWCSVAVGGALALTAFVMALVRFDALGNENTDIAFYTRVVWGMANGDRVNSIVGAHDLGLHLMPIMILFAPLSHIMPVPQTLLGAQALALGGVVPLLYRTGASISLRWWVGMALAIAWCLHPAVLCIGSTEFHPGSLALPALVAALTALVRARHLEGVALLAVAALAREDVGLVAAGAGLAVALDPGRRRIGAGIALAGLAWFLSYVLVLQPAFLPVRGSMEAHFAGLGHSAPEVFASVLTRPLDVLDRLLAARDLAYVPLLVATLGGPCLLGPRWLVPALPIALMNMLSVFPAATDLTSHYVTLTLPSLFVASALGLSRLVSLPRAGRSSVGLASAAMVLAALAGHMWQGATPLSLSFERAPYVMDRDELTLDWYARDIAKVPDVSVMAPAAVIGHLAERRHIHSWAFDHALPDVAILDLSQRQWVQVEPGRWNEPMELEIQRVDADPGYGTWRFNPPFRVAWRGLPGGAERIAHVSPGAVPVSATPQNAGWPGFVDLVALEGSLVKQREHFSGRYRELYTVRTTFYWKALGPLPERLLLRVTIQGTTKSHVRWYLPTWGVRDTCTWKPGEIIRDDQWTTSPGGWPLSALRATVILVDAGDVPWPPGAEPIELLW